MYGSHGHRLTDSGSETFMGITETYDEKITFKINTLEIPVLGKVKFGSNKLKFNILAGPSFGFGMNGEVKLKYSYSVEDANGNVIDEDSDSETIKGKFLKDGYNEDDLDDDEFPVSRTNLNLHFGGGVAYDLGKASIFLDARYILGLNDNIPDYEDADSDEKISGKSRRIGLSLGVMFPLN
ncbi:MAG: outer membrane beta-barrel protein [Saprospiraceae bacterium]